MTRTRRGLLLGGGAVVAAGAVGVVGVEEGVLPGRSRLHGLLGLDGASAYVAGFDRPVVRTFEPGAHDPAYWTRMLPAQLRFVGRSVGSAG